MNTKTMSPDSGQVKPRPDCEDCRYYREYRTPYGKNILYCREHVDDCFPDMAYMCPVFEPREDTNVPSNTTAP